MVEDSLLRDFHLSDNIMTRLFLFFCPDKMPPSFQTLQLSPEITSLIIDTIEALLALTRWHQERERSAIAAGLIGACFLTELNLEKNHPWIKLRLGTELLSSASLPAHLELDNLAQRLMTVWQKSQSQRPCVK